MEYIPFPDKKYNIIYADPPWKFASGIRSSKKVNGIYQLYTRLGCLGKRGIELAVGKK